MVISVLLVVIYISNVLEFLTIKSDKASSSYNYVFVEHQRCIYSDDRQPNDHCTKIIPNHNVVWNNFTLKYFYVHFVIDYLTVYINFFM